AISRASTALPSLLRKLRESERLLRLKAAKYQERPSLIAPCARSGSPTPGVSTLITSAPISARIIVQNGPARMRVRSTTRIPESGTPIPLFRAAKFASQIQYQHVALGARAADQHVGLARDV